MQKNTLFSCMFFLWALAVGAQETSGQDAGELSLDSIIVSPGYCKAVLSDDMVSVLAADGDSVDFFFSVPDDVALTDEATLKVAISRSITRMLDCTKTELDGNIIKLHTILPDNLEDAGNNYYNLQAELTDGDASYKLARNFKQYKAKKPKVDFPIDELQLLEMEDKKLVVEARGSWSCQWVFVSDPDEETQSGEECVIRHDKFNDGKVHHIQLQCTLNDPPFEVFYDYYFRFGVPTYTIALSTDHPLNILSDSTAVVSFQIADDVGTVFQKNEVPEGWTVQWNDDDAQNNTSYIYHATNESQEPVAHDVVATLHFGDDSTTDAVASDKITFFVWPAVEVELSGLDRDALWTSQDPTTFSVNATGGNPERWQRKWFVDGKMKGTSDTFHLKRKDAHGDECDVKLTLKSLVEENGQDIAIFEKTYQSHVSFFDHDTLQVRLSSVGPYNLLSGQEVAIDYAAQQPAGMLIGSENTLPKGWRFDL